MADEKPFSAFVPKRNGPSLPQVRGFDNDYEAEREIEASKRRYYDMKTRIAELETDVEHWRNRALLAEQKNAEQVVKLADQDIHITNLKETQIALQTEFEQGVDTWVRALNRLKNNSRVIVTPKALEQPDERTEHQTDIGLTELHRAGGERPDL